MAEQVQSGIAARNWARVARAKLAFWVRENPEHGPATTARATEMLRLFPQTQAPSSTPSPRWADLADQIRLKRRITIRTTRTGRA